MSARTRYKYLKRYPHFHVSPSQFEFPLHSAERSGKSPDARHPRVGKFITRYVSYGAFWRTGKRTHFSAINVPAMKHDKLYKQETRCESN